MFIRRVRTASGATAVQIAEYVRGRQRFVEHVGSAHTEAELGVLLERACQLLANPAQGVLDLGVEPTSSALGLVSPGGDPDLFDPATPVAPAARSGTGRVVGIDSRILFDALLHVYTNLGFDGLGDAVFRDLVIAWVVELTSLLDAGRVRTTHGARARDEASLARARQLVGLKGYVTNIPAGLMGPGEVISSYHDLWHVEQSFRMSKTALRARPMFHRTREAIEAHLTIVFTALALSRTVQARTGPAIRHVIRQLRPLRSGTIAVNGATQTFAPAIPAEQQAILDAIRGPGSHALSK